MSGTGKFVAECLAVIFLLHVAARSGSDTFQQIIENTPDASLRERMIVFEKGGIERSLTTDDYDVEGVIHYAESLVGTPHRMGGYSAKGIDCSGLVKLAHAQFNVELPHSSDEQARYGQIIFPENLKRGDLVFFHDTYATSKLVTHSGIYLGEGKFIHTSTSKGVVTTNLDESDYWKSHYLFATRLVGH